MRHELPDLQRRDGVGSWSPPGKPGAPLPSSFDSLRSLRTTPRYVWGDIPSEGPPAKAGARVEGSVAEERKELPQVKLVVLAGVVGRVAFNAQVVEESLDWTGG